MMTPLVSLALANLAFLGGHLALSHPLRAPLVRALGEKGFGGLYALIALATFAWIVAAFRAAGPGQPVLWDGTATGPWSLSSLLTLIALALLLASLRGNPALPQMSAGQVAQASPTGAFAITRHPMMWGFALWAIAHVLAMPSARTLLTAGSMGLLALLGARLQDFKKRLLLGDAWRAWEARTSYWPRLHRLGAIGAGIWLLALVAWLGVTWLHLPLAGIPAGAWRWLP